jgi:4-hydroxy-3-polyprenylbenzoate decarboxylase
MGGYFGEPEVVKCETVDLEVPAASGIVIEGHISYTETALEGPKGGIGGLSLAQRRHAIGFRTKNRTGLSARTAYPLARRLQNKSRRGATDSEGGRRRRQHDSTAG